MSLDYRDNCNRFEPGQRVRIAPHSDLWMAGIRFGTVTSVSDDWIGGRFYFVDLDHEQRNVTLAESSLLPLEPEPVSEGSDTHYGASAESTEDNEIKVTDDMGRWIVLSPTQAAEVAKALEALR